MSLDKNFAGKDGKIFLVKCPPSECGLENYASAVATGICAWCGFDANKKIDDGDKNVSN